MDKEYREFIESLQPGDKVWVGNRNITTGKERIKTVLRTTEYYIFLEKGNEFNKFRRKPAPNAQWTGVGHQTANLTWRERITQRATGKEVKQYEAEVLADKLERDARERADADRVAAQQQLSALFEDGYVSIEEHGMTVTLRGLTEGQVLRLAKLLNEEKI